MIKWLRESPGLSRAGALVLLTLAIAAVAPWLGQPIAWGTALVFGGALSLASRWPIILPDTGVRVVLLAGLLIQVLWRHGLPTAMVLLCFEYGLRMLVLYRGRYMWEWYRPLFTMAATVGAYWLARLAAGSLPGPDHLLAWIDFPAFVLAYSFWILLNMAWTILKAPTRARSRLEDFLHCMQQTWWVPLAYLLIAWGMDWLYLLRYPLETLACVGLVWFQSRIGPVFTTIHQDKAAAEMIRQLATISPRQRARSQRVLRVADTLARTIPLSGEEIRLVGYAALLQDSISAEEPAPLWLSNPTEEQRATLTREAEEAARRIIRNGALQEVASFVRLRHAHYDGTGNPDLAGEAIPMAAQVLMAANAIEALSPAEQTQTQAELRAAVEWLRTHAAARFHPKVLGAMVQAFASQPTVLGVEQELPQTVQQLQGLVMSPDTPSTLQMGFKRLWLQMRGQPWMVQELPPEVQAVGRMATLFAASTETDQTAQIAVEAVGQLFGAKVFLTVRESDSDDLKMVIKAAYGYQRVPLIDRRFSVCGLQMSRGLTSQTPVHLPDMREVNSPLAREITQLEGVRSGLMVPLVGRGRTTGMLMVCMQNHHWFTPREVGLIQMMAGQAAIALENARLMTEAAERLDHISNLKAFTDTLLDNLSTSILVVDTEGRLVMLNAAARRRFATDKELQVGEPLPPELCCACSLNAALGGESAPEIDLPWGNAILEVQSIPLQDGNGLLLGAICLARDVTKVRTMEQQVRRVEKLAAIGELAAGAAHEIRNPLTSIRGFMQLLEARAKGVPGDYFQIILNEIDRIDGIIHDLLLLARPAELQRVPVALDSLAEQVLLLHEQEFERQGIRLVREFQPDMRQGMLDPKMVRQLLYNLLLNAAQAMPFGGTLTVEVSEVGPDQIRLAISDTGVGISAENLQRLFVPFFTTKEEGTGLGLALCYSIVQAHQGRIDVESKVGVGTTFRILLPVR